MRTARHQADIARRASSLRSWCRALRVPPAVENELEDILGRFRGLSAMKVTDAARMTGFSAESIRANCPIIRESARKHLVRAIDLEAFVTRRMEMPQ